MVVWYNLDRSLSFESGACLVVSLRKSLTILLRFMLTLGFLSFAILAPAFASSPEVIITGVADQQFYNTDVSPVIEIVGDNLNNAATVIELNGEPFVSGTAISQEGTYSLYVYAEDTLGNGTEQNMNFTIDKTPPAVSFVGITDNSYIKGIIQLKANINETNISDVSIVVDGQEITTSLPFAFNSALFQDGLRSFSIKVTDKASNVVTETINVNIDNTKPAGTLSVRNNYSYTKNRMVYLSTPAIDNLKIASMRFRNTDDASWGKWLPYSKTTKWALANGDGKKIVYSQFRDMAGNLSNISQDSITLDTRKPSGKITINRNNIYSNRRKARLNLAARDNYALFKMRFKNAGGSWSRWFSFAKGKNWILKPDNGASKVHAEFKDKAGNISAAVSDTIFLDNQPPVASIKTSANIITELPSVNIKIQWPSFDRSPSSGVAAYDIQYRFKDGTWITWLQDTPSSYGFFSASPGFTYLFRVRAKDRAGNVGAWSRELKVTVTDFYGQFISEPTIVLIRSQQRVRIYNADGMMIRTFLVSTGKILPYPGHYRVYSKSPQSKSMNGAVNMKHMVRFTRASNGTPVGFHSVIYKSNGTVIDRHKLGQPVSRGCVRSDFPNAAFIYNFAPIGTKVWVVN